MTIIQLAKFLELLGFFLASVFGGILLDELVGGKIAKRSTSLIVGFADGSIRFVQRLEKYIITGREPGEPMWHFFLLLLSWLSLTAMIIVGWVEGISILLRVGIALYSVYAIFILFALRAAMSERRKQVVSDGSSAVARDDRQDPLGGVFIAAYIISAVLCVSGVAWLLRLTEYFIGFLLKVFSSTMRILVNPKVPKVAFIVLGYIMLLVGLIIDAIVVF